MHWSLFVLAAIALVLAHGLRLPSISARGPALFAFLIGLIASAGAIKVLAAASDIGRSTDFDRYVNAAVLAAQEDDAPLIVFTGASYSRNGIDPDRLTRDLRARGYPHRVVSLSIEAASILERDAHLTQFMELSGRVPDVVFVEVASDFDQRAAYMFRNSKFSTRAIEQFDLRTTAWTGYGILGGACHGTKDCLMDAAFLGVHSALNLLNIGLVGGGEPAAAVAAETAYDPQTSPRRDSDPALALDSRLASTYRGPQWARAFRQSQARRLNKAGVREVAYYQPPALDPEVRAYMDGLCVGEFEQHACISPNDPALMAQLNGDYWFDPSHLLDSGTEIYNAWLVEQIISSGVLDGSQ